ncbi:MAG: hypothetical protein ACOY5Y_05125 [Pseudomonadota bacterium]
MGVSRISVGSAISAGFRLIEREPLTFFIWCGLYFAIGAVSAVMSWPETAAYYDALGSGAAVTDPRIQPRWGLVQWISLLASLLIMICLPSAILRAVLYPTDRGYFYLRLSGRELWLTITSVVLFVLAMVAYLVALLFVGILSGVAAALGGGGGVAVVGIVMLIVVPVLLAVGIWAAMRLSLATTMGFVEKKLRIVESWRLTKGHALRIFLVMLVLSVLTVAAFAVLIGGSLVALAASAGGGEISSPQDMFGLLSGASLPMQLIYLAFSAVLFVGASVFSAAAWAEMYRQLRPPVAEAFA